MPAAEQSAYLFKSKEIQVPDRACLLQRWNKLIGHNQGTRFIVITNQCLSSDKLLSEIHLRLQIHLKALIFQCLHQDGAVRKLQNRIVTAAVPVGIWIFPIELHFILIHVFICIRYPGGYILTGGCPYMSDCPLAIRTADDCLLQNSHLLQKFLFLHSLNKHNEFIPADSIDGAGVKHLFQYGCSFCQHLISIGMSQMVVDILQSVDIHIDDTKGNLPAIELIQILKVAISIIHTG